MKSSEPLFTEVYVLRLFEQPSIPELSSPLHPGWFLSAYQQCLNNEWIACDYDTMLVSITEAGKAALKRHTSEDRIPTPAEFRVLFRLLRYGRGSYEGEVVENPDASPKPWESAQESGWIKTSKSIWPDFELTIGGRLAVDRWNMRGRIPTSAEARVLGLATVEDRGGTADICAWMACLFFGWITYAGLRTDSGTAAFNRYHEQATPDQLVWKR